MLIGQRLRDIREIKKLSQDDIEKATGLVRPYIPRAENGHTVPSVGTFQKWAKALGMQLYQVLHEGEKPPEPQSYQARWMGSCSDILDAKSGNLTDSDISRFLLRRCSWKRKLKCLYVQKSASGHAKCYPHGGRVVSQVQSAVSAPVALWVLQMPLHRVVDLRCPFYRTQGDRRDVPIFPEHTPRTKTSNECSSPQISQTSDSTQTPLVRANRYIGG